MDRAKGMLKSSLITIACFLIVTLPEMKSTRHTFKAAVYEHEVLLPPFTTMPVFRGTALRHMQANLDVYSTQASAAKQRGADILVFPENGLYGYNFSRATIKPYLEFIPDPHRITWSACDDPHRYPDTEVQRQLSCMAKDNSVYLVANMGEIQECLRSIDLRCPEDGSFHYNTAVAFDPEGQLVAKYQKSNLYQEPQFDKQESQIKYFDTPFGRFGLFICFDILFKSPAIDMITSHQIRNVAFPTAWIDSLPVLSAIGWHSAFARGQKINLLSANLHLPSKRVHGSGIYTPEGPAVIYYDRTAYSGPKLLVEEVDVIDTKPVCQSCDSVQGRNRVSIFTSIYKRIRSVFRSFTFTRTTRMFQKKGFNFIALRDNDGTVPVCQNRLCCTFDYSFDRHPRRELMVLGSLDGLFHNKYYSQMCVVLKCPDNDENKCGNYTLYSNTSFAYAKLDAVNVDENTSVFPQVVVANEGQLKLTDPNDWSWSSKHKSLLLNQVNKTPLLTMAIVARDYSKDS